MENYFLNIRFINQSTHYLVCIDGVFIYSGLWVFMGLSKRIYGVNKKKTIIIKSLAILFLLKTWFMWEIKCSFLAGHLRVTKNNLWLFVNLQVSWIFGRLTSVRPRCTETRTTAWGWIWPAEGCSQQPAREVTQHREVQLTPAYVRLGSGFSGKLMPWTCKQHDWKGIKSSGNIHRQTLESPQ